MNTLLVDVTTEKLTSDHVLVKVKHGPSRAYVEACCSNEEVEDVKLELQDELCLIVEQIEWWVH